MRGMHLIRERINSLAFVFAFVAVTTSVLFQIAHAGTIKPSDLPKLKTALRDYGEVAIYVRFNSQVIGTKGLNSHDSNARAARERTTNALFKKYGTAGIRQIKRFPLSDHIALVATGEALFQLERDEAVALIEEDAVVRPGLLTSTKVLGNRWDDLYQTESNYWGGGERASVVILDTGVNTSNSYLGPSLWEVCFSTNGGGYTSLCPNRANMQEGAGAARPCTVSSACSHGTNVAAIAIARNVNHDGSSASGVARLARYVAIQIYSQRTGTNSIVALSSDIERALNWVITHRGDARFVNWPIVAVNASLGNSIRHTVECWDSVLRNEVETLMANRIATIVSTGNDSFNDGVSFPACTPQVIGVGATTKPTESGMVKAALFSNKAGGNLLDLYAPGVGIVTPTSNYVALTGTSSAAPHVTGAWAVVRTQRPTWTVNQVLTHLKGGQWVGDAATGENSALILR